MHAELPMITQDFWAGVIEVVLAVIILFLIMGVSCLPGVILVV